MKTLKKISIGKRYWLDGQNDISGLYFGTDERGYYLFGALNNNYLYLTNAHGQAVMPVGDYERAPELVTIIS